MSLRARLLIAAVALVAAGLAAANIATYRYFSSFLLQRVDEQLVSARGPAARALAVGGWLGPGESVFPPIGTYAEFRDPDGRTTAGPIVFTFGQQVPPGPVVPASLPGSGSGPGPDSITFTAGPAGGVGPSYRVLASSAGPGQGTLIVAIPLTEVGTTRHRLVAVEGIVSGIVLVAVAGLALWLVRLGLRPLEGMGETAGAIAAGDLSRRVEPANSRTEVGRLGLALNSMLAQIEAAFKERRASEARLRRFVADASHELRTPLTSIRGYAELFRRGAGVRPEDLAMSMRRIEGEASRMGVLVDDLLLLARLDQGRPLEREPVDLARIAGEAVESARAVDPNRAVDLVVEGQAVVSGDEGRLRQVLDNLLDNFRVHTPPGTGARVEIRPGPEDVVVLTVADEGPGLPPEIAGRVFERFFRGDPARSRKTGGAGLGLSIASAIVEAHGGTIQASSAPGSGTVFEVRIPTGAGAGEDTGAQPLGHEAPESSPTQA